MNRQEISMAALAMATWCSSIAMAQSAGPPFFGPGAAGFDPEISVVNTGVLTDVQVVVSADEKYVTINAFNLSASRLNELSVFQVQQTRQANGGTGPGAGGNAGTMLGYVGNAGMIDDDEPNVARAPLPNGGMPVSSSPSQILKTDRTASASVLRKEGMFKITMKR